MRTKRTQTGKETMTKEQLQNVVCSLVANEEFCQSVNTMSDGELGMYLVDQHLEDSDENILKVRKAMN